MERLAGRVKNVYAHRSAAAEYMAVAHSSSKQVPNDEEGGVRRRCCPHPHFETGSM